MKRPKAKGKEPSTDFPQDQHRKRRVLLTRDELYEQPAAISNSLLGEIDHLRRIASDLKNRSFSRIIIVGCGDSWLIGVGVRLAFERLLKVPTEAMQALDYSLYFSENSNRESLVIGISSSGTTSAVIKALNKAKANKAYTIGMSNTIGSPLLEDYDNHILVRATRKGWPTQASTAAMALLIQLGLLLSISWNTTDIEEITEIQNLLDQLPSIVEDVIKDADAPMKTQAKNWVNARLLFFCAAGSNLAAAAFGCAKVKELSPIHAVVIPMEEFHHYRSIKPGDPLFLLAPDKAIHHRALDTIKVTKYDQGNSFALIPKGEKEISHIADQSFALPITHPILDPIIYSIPLHIFAYYFSMEKFKNNLGFEKSFTK